MIEQVALKSIEKRYADAAREQQQAIKTTSGNAGNALFKAFRNK